MKKILVINNKYKELGGEDSNIVDEINLLSKVCSIEYLEFDNSNDLNFFDLISFFINSNFVSNKLIEKKIDEFQPDIIYVNNTWFKANLGIFKIIRKKNIPVLLKIHNFRYWCANSYRLKNHLRGNDICPACSLKDNKKILNRYFPDSLFKSFILIKYIRKLISILKTKEIKILTITDFHKQFLIDLGIPKNKIFKYNNPITLNEDKGVNYNVNSDYVVFAGRITESKGVEELLLSWQKFLNIDGLSLKIIGEGNLDFKLKNIYNSNNIEFIGHLNNYDVKELISKSRAVITATKMYEGQPRLLCEASSLGVPSIFPKFGGMNEFFPPNYELAFEQYNYDDLNEKLLLLKNKIMLEKYSQENFQYINSYLSEEKLEKIFLNIIS
tara:strand:- start:1811 stop:2962 length:1152 start_codon:yes stop_codon:yes gene_type:complete